MDDLRIRLSRAKEAIIAAMAAMKVEELRVTEYSKKYLADYKPKLAFALDAISLTLLKGVELSGKPANELVVLESGGGVGIMSILAASAGFREVMYNDIYEVSCQDFPVIAEAFGVRIPHIIEGDSAATVHYCRTHNLAPDLVVSRNVIEHIYDIRGYLEDLYLINPSVTLSFSTTANAANPLVKAYTQRIHKRAEYQGITDGWASRDMDATASYLGIRKRMIAEKDPALNQDQLDQLAKGTRGLAGPDITRAVEQFREHGRIENAVESTNTCDPQTGNWAENLLSYPTLQKTFHEAGFELSILPGFWNRHYRRAPLRMAANVLNGLMKLVPSTSLALSPFIILCARAKKR